MIVPHTHGGTDAPECTTCGSVTARANETGFAETGLPPGMIIRVCEKDHGGQHNAASVYGHHGSIRVCIRMYGTDTWVFDPRWETARVNETQNHLIRNPGGKKNAFAGINARKSEENR